MKDWQNIRTQKIVLGVSILVIISGLAFAIDKDWGAFISVKRYNGRSSQPFILIILFACFMLIYSYLNIKRLNRKK